MYNFGSPRVGNREFAVLFNSLVDNSFRIKTSNDIVPMLPSETVFSRKYTHVKGHTVIHYDGDVVHHKCFDECKNTNKQDWLDSKQWWENALEYSEKEDVEQHALSGIAGTLISLIYKTLVGGGLFHHLPTKYLLHLSKMVERVRTNANDAIFFVRGQ